MFVVSLQTKRDEPSNVVDYEKIDNDARVSRPNFIVHLRDYVQVVVL